LPASRIALVPTGRTSSIRDALQNEANTSAVDTARSIASGWSSPLSPIPAPMRTGSRISSLRIHGPPVSQS
jgi:hypothetical protein